MKDLKASLVECYGKDLEQRKRWYSPAAEAYHQVRPRYPEELIQQVVEIAQLSANSTLLEIGCGPAIATHSFASLGCSMTCLEPNPDFYQLAQQNCAPYPHVEIQNLSFEEWEPKTRKYDAVLAASSFHWIPPDIGYPKAANALHPDGYLILLWNKELQPRYEVYQQLSEIYQAIAPALGCYEDRAMQEEILQELGQMSIDSGKFKNLISGQIASEVTYSVDEYLMLLTTYSPYLKLELQQRQQLFEQLRHAIEKNGSTIQLSYLSAFHIAQPV
ncbi:SAM-dependent methyltransferase [filamentous cyanobacterium CCP1]|nr:SAM-dependent methyltransferase [filamentous cyanobacterium CCP2]PSB67773.1 SAM-dependent methyltransferase [filamentous cyanobacterium CCP1]